MIWTDERITELKGHVANKLSGGEIGAIMGLSRNSIIGKVHRLGLRLLAGFTNNNPQKKPNPKGAVNNRFVRKPSLPPLETPQPVDAAAYDNDRLTYGVKITDLNDHVCHFPLWQADDDPRFYCGAEAVDGCSWCRHHRNRAFIKSSYKTGTYHNWRGGY